MDIDACMVLHASVAQGFVQRFVAVGQIHILAHHGDGDFLLGVLDFVDQSIPSAEVCGWCVDVEFFTNQAVESLLVQHAGDFVNRVDVPHGDNAPLRDVREQADFFFFFGWNWAICPA